MKQLIVILFALLPFSAFCQTPAKTASDKFAVGIVFSPDYCYRTLTSDASSEWIAENREDREIPKFGFTTGASVVFNPTSRIGLETGVLLSDKGEKTYKEILNTGGPEHPVRMYKYHYVYLDIPTKVNYYFLTGRVKLFASAGVSTNIFLKHTQDLTIEYSNDKKEKESISSDRGFNKVNFAAVAGFGLDYDITDKLRLRAEPIFRHSVTPIIDTPIKSYLFSTGINFGIYFKL